MPQNEDIVEVWLEEAKSVAQPGTRAEKATDLIGVLYAALKHVGSCDRCSTCCLYTEQILLECEEIVEKL